MAADCPGVMMPTAGVTVNGPMERRSYLGARSCCCSAFSPDGCAGALAFAGGAGVLGAGAPLACGGEAGDGEGDVLEVGDGVEESRVLLRSVCLAEEVLQIGDARAVQLDHSVAGL